MPNPKTAKQPSPEDDPAVRAFYEAFRLRLRTMREDAGLTQEELCDFVGIPLASYKHIEGKRASKFPLHKLEKLSRLLRQSCDYILTGRDNPRVPRSEQSKRAA